MVEFTFKEIVNFYVMLIREAHVPKQTSLAKLLPPRTNYSAGSTDTTQVKCYAQEHTPIPLRIESTH